MGPNNPRGAIRSDSMLHIDEEITTAYEEAQRDTTPTEDQDLRVLQKIATLDAHPGWQIVRDQFLEVIDSYRSGRKLAEFLADYTLTDEQIGQATRNMNLIAGELTGVLNSVVVAVQEVERHKQEGRNERAGRMGPLANRKSQ